MTLRYARSLFGVLIASMLLNGCASPHTAKLPEAMEAHATLTGGNIFLGFGWISCGISEVDGKTFSIPYPRKLELTPGRHRVTIWCGGFIITAGGGEYTTLEFSAKAGHAYQLRIFSDGIVDETTGMPVEIVYVVDAKTRQRLQQEIRSWLSPGEKILLVSRAYWFERHGSLLSRQHGRGTLVLTASSLLFGDIGSKLPFQRIPYQDIRTTKLTKDSLVDVTLINGRSYRFEFMKLYFRGHDDQAGRRAFAILRE
ncbi:MAG: hypothetical protein P8047_04360 [Gammaproteobacteria bacterium]